MRPSATARIAPAESSPTPTDPRPDNRPAAAASRASLDGLLAWPDRAAAGDSVRESERDTAFGKDGAAPVAPLNGVLLDERSGITVRRVIGLLLSRSREADFAVARIRLGAVDLAAAELARVRRCRVLVGRFDVQSLAAAPEDHPASLQNLLAFLRSGRIEVRSAAGSGWIADFSVFRGLPSNAALPRGRACLVGAHSFWNVDMASGPSFTCVLGSAGATARAASRFEELWHRGYDVLPVLVHTLGTALGENAGADGDVG